MEPGGERETGIEVGEGADGERGKLSGREAAGSPGCSLTSCVPAPPSPDMISLLSLIPGASEERLLFPPTHQNLGPERPLSPARAA